MLTANTLRLLEALADGSVEELNPIVDTDDPRSRYPDAERLLDCTSTQVSERLNALADDDLLVKEFHSKLHVCPECSSTGLEFATVCTGCESNRVLKKDVIEHLTCGCVKPREAFEQRNGDYSCPKCGDVLRSVGVDYAKMGELFVCQDCEDRFDEPASRLVCGDCDAAVPPAAADERGLYSYQFNEDRREWVEGQLFVKPALRNLLEDYGYEVDLDATIVGESGREYDVHFCAGDGGFGTDIVGGIADTPTEDEIARLHMVADDVNARPFLVALADTVSDDLLTLADHFDVTLLRKDGTTEIDAAADALVQRAASAD